jgi:hypothetical protein
MRGSDPEEVVGLATRKAPLRTSVGQQASPRVNRNRCPFDSGLSGKWTPQVAPKVPIPEPRCKRRSKNRPQHAA